MITGAADCSATQYLSDIASAADNCITVHSTYVTVNPTSIFKSTAHSTPVPLNQSFVSSQESVASTLLLLRHLC